LCGVDVAVMNSSADRARPVPYRHVPDVAIDGTACAAELTGREIPVHHDQRPTIPSALVFEHPAELTPSGIGNSFCASTLRRVRNHAGDIKVLDDYHVVGFDEICRELVKNVISCIADAFMDPRYFACLAPSAVGLMSVRISFLLSGKFSLLYGEPFFQLAEMPWIGDDGHMSVAVEQSGVALDSKVYRHRPARGGKKKHRPAGWQGRFFAQHGYVMPSAAVALHGHADNSPLERLGNDRAYPAYLGEFYPAVTDGDVAAHIPGRVGLHRVSLALEPRLPVLFRIVPAPCVGEVAERRLEGYGVPLGEPACIGALLESGEPVCAYSVGQSSASGFLCLFPEGEGFVENEASLTEHAVYPPLLFGSGIYAHPVRPHVPLERLRSAWTVLRFLSVLYITHSLRTRRSARCHPGSGCTAGPGLRCFRSRWTRSTTGSRYCLPTTPGGARGIAGRATVRTFP
jgi:hypothetical protein